MTIGETIKDPFTEGIIKTLGDLFIPTILNDEDRIDLNVRYYYGWSNCKTISSFYEKLIENNTSMSSIARIIDSMYHDKWTKTYNALMSDYNPVHNYDMTETRTPDLTDEMSGNDTTNYSGTNESIDNGTSNSQVYGFNSTNPVDSNKNIVDTTTTESANSNTTKTNTHTTTHKGTEKLERSGNIGVTTSQKMLNEEIEVRKFLFYEELMKDVDRVLALQVY